MTKLNDDQQYQLDTVARIKGEVDAQIALAKLAFEDEVERLKQPLKAAVGRAVKYNVPARRIGMALDTSDHKTIKSYFPANTEV